MLDRWHGVSYFRRWNGRRKFFNGLELHKCSHHFDKLNFLLESRAAEVTASGALRFYGAAAPHKFSGERCSACVHAGECAYAVNYPGMPESETAVMFFKHRGNPDAYTPDLCIYAPDIDIEDTFTAGIRFENGVPVSFSMCAHANCEGERLVFEGETGRIEYTDVYRRIHENPNDPLDLSILPERSLKLIRYGSAQTETIEIPTGIGGHGGADFGIFDDLFTTGKPSEIMPALED